MDLRKMLVLLAIAFLAVVGLGVYVWQLERHGGDGKEVSGHRDFPFYYPDADNVAFHDVARRIQIQRSDKTIVLEKVETGNWRLRSPVDARADRSNVLAILEGIRNLRIHAIVTPDDETETGKDPFGLRKPRLKVTFWLNDHPHEFTVGKTIRGQSEKQHETYLRVAGELRILVVENALADRLEQDISRFRDRRVFERNPERALAIRATAGGHTLALERAENLWQVVAPVKDQADPAAVNALLRKAKSLEVHEYVSEDAADLAEFGLDTPQLTFQIRDADGDLMTLLVGAEATEDGKQLYAKRNAERSIFTIRRALLRAVVRSLADLQDKPQPKPPPSKAPDLRPPGPSRSPNGRGGLGQPKR